MFIPNSNLKETGGGKYKRFCWDLRPTEVEIKWKNTCINCTTSDYKLRIMSDHLLGWFPVENRKSINEIYLCWFSALLKVFKVNFQSIYYCILKWYGPLYLLRAPHYPMWARLFTFITLLLFLIIQTIQGNGVPPMCNHWYTEYFFHHPWCVDCNIWMSPHLLWQWILLLSPKCNSFMQFLSWKKALLKYEKMPPLEQFSPS